MTPTTVIFAFAALLGIAVTLGVAYSVARSAARDKDTEDLSRRNEVLDRALTRSETERTRIETKLDTVMNANAVLQETVSGTAAVKHLAEEIRREESARREEHLTQMTLLKDIIAQLKDSRGAIGR
ncbi:MAG: hypothetical protein ACRDYV_20835 [Acidimicrobiia bacterium]